MFMKTRSDVLAVGTATLFALLAGCSSEPGPAPAAGPSGTDGPVVDQEHEGEHSLHDWWCVEHGVPEAECALCNPDLIAQFKEEGDWCEQHNRPESQCFLCDPSRFETFAARYEAKFGERPPQPTE